MRSGKSFTIGAVIAHGDRTWCEMLTGAQGLLAEHEYHLMLDIAATAARAEEMQIDSLRAKRVDGLLVAAMEGETENAAHFTEQYQTLREHVPVVLMERTLPGGIVDSVTVDDPLAGRLACEHLLELGHQRIAFLYAPYHDSAASRARRHGYNAAMRHAGLLPIPWPVDPVKGEPVEDAYATITNCLDSSTLR